MNVPEQRWDDLRAVETALAYRFKNPALLDQALTHRSFTHEAPGEAAGDNERLEFLGDAVLDLGISSILMKNFPDYQEGRLTKLRSSLVNDRSLARLAQRLDLGDHLRLGKGEEGTGGRKKSSVLANTLEALLAAVYLDAGFDQSLEMIADLFSPLLEAGEDFLGGDSKSAIQELCQSRFNQAPCYTLLDEYGPDHAKTYLISLSINGRQLAEGTGRSKKEAEQDAARIALEELTGVRG